MTALEAVVEAMHLGATILVSSSEVQVRGEFPPSLGKQLQEHRQEIRETLHTESYEGSWKFFLAKVPNQQHAGRVDVWLRGSRLDCQQEAALFIGEEQK